MTEHSEHSHRRHRPYQRSKAKANAHAAIAGASDSTGADDPYDPLIPGDDVGGGDPGVALLLTSASATRARML